MNNEIELGIGIVLYILYIVGINLHLVTLCKSRNETMHKSKGVQRIKSGHKSRTIKRGMEWPE